jgi:hypothetical protein
MQSIFYILMAILSGLLSACATDTHTANYHPHKIIEAINTQADLSKNTFIFIDAPTGFVASRLANCAVDKEIDTGKVAAIVSALALKTATVVVAGENDHLTATTLSKAINMGKDRISGAKAIMVNNNGTQNVALQKTLNDLATANGVTLTFIENRF